MASNQSVQAWDRFLKVCKNTQVHVNPPAMDYMYLPEVEEELYNACKAAADAGAYHCSLRVLGLKLFIYEKQNDI